MKSVDSGRSNGSYNIRSDWRGNGWKFKRQPRNFFSGCLCAGMEKCLALIKYILFPSHGQFKHHYWPLFSMATTKSWLSPFGVCETQRVRLQMGKICSPMGWRGEGEGWKVSEVMLEWRCLKWVSENRVEMARLKKKCNLQSFLGNPVEFLGKFLLIPWDFSLFFIDFDLKAFIGCEL